MNQKERNDFVEAVKAHGEVHAIYEEHDKELEIRNGQLDTDHRDGDGSFTLWKNGQPFTFYYDRIVDWYEPHEIWH